MSDGGESEADADEEVEKRDGWNDGSTLLSHFRLSSFIPSSRSSTSFSSPKLVLSFTPSRIREAGVGTFLFGKETRRQQKSKMLGGIKVAALALF